MREPPPFHRGINYASLSFSGFPALLATILVVVGTGTLFHPAEYILVMVGIVTFAATLVPLIRWHRRKDDLREEKLFSGHLTDDKENQK